jgi:hypothetical protein
MKILTVSNRGRISIMERKGERRMDSKAIARMLLVAGMAALLLALSAAGLAVARELEEPGPAAEVTVSPPDTEQSIPLPLTADSPCDTVCVDESCATIPVDWLGPVTITDTFIIYPTSACLCGNEDDGYRVEGEGEFFLPNIQTDQGTDGIYVRFVMDVVSLYPSLVLEPVCVQFTGTWEEGVPIGESGFLLTSMEGEVTFEPEPAVQVSGTIESEQQLPDDGPAVSGEGTLWISLEQPYDVSFEGTLIVLTIQAIEAAMTLDQSWGFAGSMTLTSPACGGGAFLHVWEEGDGVYGFSGSASLTCTIEADSLTPEGWPDGLPGIPSEDIVVTADGEMGDFCLVCDGGDCVEQTYGLWAGTALDLSLPEWVVEPGTITARFFISPTGIMSATTNLVRCEETNQAISDFRSPIADYANIPLADPSENNASSLALFCLNKPPTITVTNPSAPGEPGSGSYTIRWTADDPDDEAVVSLYYDRDGTGRDGRLIAHCLSEGEGSYVWDTSEVGSGTYYIYGRIDDGRNLTVVSYSTGTVKVEDATPPAAPSSPSVSLGSSVAELSWEANAEDDVIGYQVYYGSEPGVYSGSCDATNVTSFRLPQKPSPQSAYLAVSAYDSSGNSSPPSAEVRLWFAYLPLVLKDHH